MTKEYIEGIIKTWSPDYSTAAQIIFDNMKKEIEELETQITDLYDILDGMGN